MKKKRILVFGASGQLGRCLASEVEKLPSEQQWNFLSRSEADLTDEASWLAAIDRIKPQIIINAAAYTQVDRAETEAELCCLVNETFPKKLSELCQVRRIFLIHYSTDYVYRGDGTHAHLETEAPDPQNVYGKTKAAGDAAVFASNCSGLIFRTSWVYSEFGKNFVKTILKLSKEKPELKIVNDQIGNPTYARDLAQATLQSLQWIDSRKNQPLEIIHFANAGSVSWFEFARKAISQPGGAKLVPISTSEYPTPAKRPLNSRLDLGKITSLLGAPPRLWSEALEECIRNLENTHES